MKKSTFYVAVFLASSCAISQEVVSSQGDSYQGTNASFDYTIGEPVIFTGNGNNHTITQGFHQTNWEYAGTDNFEIEIDLNVYPNPVHDMLTIESPDYLNKNFAVYDAAGKLVAQGELVQEKTLIQTAKWAKGAYSVVIKNNEKQKIKNIKLIKH